jgi:hypothetical protein
VAAAAAAAFPFNTAAGLTAGANFAGWVRQFEADLRANVPVSEFLARHVAHPDHQFHAGPALPLLRAARVGAFADPAIGPDRRAVAAAAGALLFGGLASWWVLRRRINPAAAFRADADGLREAFRLAAAATGKPRGLTWVAVEPSGEPLFVPRGRGVVALLPVVVRFEPVPGSEMEGMPAAREPRPAVAVFTFEGLAWTTAGRAVFNLTAEQVAARVGDSLRESPLS